MLNFDNFLNETFALLSSNFDYEEIQTFIDCLQGMLDVCKESEEDEEI